MNIPFAQFKKLNKEFTQLSKLIEDGEIVLNHGYGQDYKPTFSQGYSALRFKGIEEMYAFCKIRNIPLYRLTCQSSGEWFTKVHESNRTLETRITGNITNRTAQLFKTLKLVPESISANHRPKVIQHDPIETTLGDFTYRIITEETITNFPTVNLIARNDEPIYDYLDKGFYIKTVYHETGKTEADRQFVISNEYNVHTAHIFMMCEMQPSLTEMLRDGCFVHSTEAEMLRLRMHKKMDKGIKNDYTALSTNIENDHKKNTTMLVVGKLISGDVSSTVINNITLTRTAAVYEHVSVEAEDLLPVLFKSLDFNGEFDIYTIVDVYSKHIETSLVMDEPKTATVNLTPNEHDAQLEEEEETPNVLKSLATFSINGISITPAVSNTYQRYINKIRINKEEIGKAIYRASCHRSADDYRLFLKSICKMSIKWHDVVSNGLSVKIHSTITPNEYKNETPGPNAPTLNFVIDKAEKCVKLVVSKERKVKISLAKLVRRVESLNKKTDNFWIRSRTWQDPFAYRTYEWCQHNLISILIEATTFTVKGVNEAGQPTETKQTFLEKPDIVQLLAKANEAKKAIIEKSKEFLSMAVKLTNAEEIMFLDQKAYKVQGTLRTYAVIIKTAKVYDFETKQYRCVVNDKHYAGAGYDDVAARLLSLKNDTVLQDSITTLRGAAQPGAENAHGYRPERETDIEQISATVDKALAAIQ